MSQSLPLVRAGHLGPHIALLKEIGAPVEGLLRRSGLPSAAADDPQLSVCNRLVYRFCRLAARRVGSPDLGMHAAMRTPIDSVRWMMDCLRAARTLSDALAAMKALCRRESKHMQLWLQSRDQTTWLCYRGSVPFEEDGARQVEQLMVGWFARWLQTVLGSDWTPKAVAVRGPDAEPYVQEKLFAGSEIRVHQGVTAIGFDTGLLYQPIAARTGCHAAAPALSGSDATPADLVDALRLALQPYLREKPPTVELAAAMAGTSVRSLQRELSRSGVTFSELIDRLRRETALELLRESDAKLVDIAFELGFSDPAHFTRAFRRWTGTAPSTFRRLAASA